MPFRCLAAAALVAAVLSANAQISFGPPILIDTAGSSNGIRQVLRVADVNGDGFNDVFHLAGTNPAARCYLSAGPAALGAAQNLPGVFDNISDAATGDWNSDGRPDLLVLDKGANTALRYQNQGGAYGAPLVITSSKFTILQHVISADFTGDGAEDVIILDHFDALLMKGLGDGTFDTAASLVPDSLQTEFYHLVKGRFNNDTFPDFALASSGALVFLNNGAGHFMLGCTTTGTTISFLMEAGDLNGDGLDDLVYKDNVARVLINDNDGTHFTQSQLLQPANFSYRAFDMQDMDGDGDRDLYAVYDQINRAVWFENTGAGQLDSQQIIHAETGGGFYNGIAADLNGDGRPEPIWANINGRIGYHLNQAVTSVAGAGKPGVAVQLHPNPTVDAFVVESPGDGWLTVTDATGSTVARQSLRAGSNAVPAGWPAGLYYGTVQSGAARVVLRLVIAR